MYSEDVSLIVDSSPPFDAGHDDVDVIIDEIDADESFDASSPILEAGASANSYNV
jgi:hypothetical protein